MFTVEDLSKRYTVKPHTILAWLHSGELKGINVGRAIDKLKPRWRISQAAVDAFEAARTPTVEQTTRRRVKPAGDVVQFYA
jgi:hypothetical protein